MKEFDAWMGQEETKDRLPTNTQYRCEKGGLGGGTPHARAFAHSEMRSAHWRSLSLERTVLHRVLLSKGHKLDSKKE